MSSVSDVFLLFVLGTAHDPNEFHAQVLDEADQLLQTDQQKALADIYQRLPQHGVGDLRLQVID